MYDVSLFAISSSERVYFVGVSVGDDDIGIVTWTRVGECESDKEEESVIDNMPKLPNMSLNNINIRRNLIF